MSAVISRGARLSPFCTISRATLQLSHSFDKHTSREKTTSRIRPDLTWTVFAARRIGIPTPHAPRRTQQGSTLTVTSHAHRVADETKRLRRARPRKPNLPMWLPRPETKIRNPHVWAAKRRNSSAKLRPVLLRNFGWDNTYRSISIPLHTTRNGKFAAKAPGNSVWIGPRRFLPSHTRFDGVLVSNWGSARPTCALQRFWDFTSFPFHSPSNGLTFSNTPKSTVLFLPMYVTRQHGDGVIERRHISRSPYWEFFTMWDGTY